MLKILYILLIILFSRVAYSQNLDEGHCFCGSNHEDFLFISINSNYNIENNWSNGLSFQYTYKNDFFKDTYLNFSINSTRLGSSLFSDKVNQDFIILSIGNEIFPKIRFKYGLIGTSLRVGYLNTEKVRIVSINNNLILSPELGIYFGKFFINFGYNLLNTFNVNNNLNPFYISLNYSLFMNYYCGSSGRRFWD